MKINSMPKYNQGNNVGYNQSFKGVITPEWVIQKNSLKKIRLVELKEKDVEVFNQILGRTKLCMNVFRSDLEKLLDDKISFNDIKAVFHGEQPCILTGEKTCDELKHNLWVNEDTLDNSNHDTVEGIMDGIVKNIKQNAGEKEIKCNLIVDDLDSTTPHIDIATYSEKSEESIPWLQIFNEADLLPENKRAFELKKRFFIA